LPFKVCARLSPQKGRYSGEKVDERYSTVLALVEEDSLVTIEAQRRDLDKVDLDPLLCAHEQLLFLVTDKARA